MLCPHCGDASQAPIDSVCTSCAQALNECPSCALQNPLIAKACGDCGQSLGVSVSTAASQVYKRPSNVWLWLGVGAVLASFVIMFLWNPYLWIFVVTLAVFCFLYWRKRNKGMGIRKTLLGCWQMYYVYTAVVALIIALALHARL